MPSKINETDVNDFNKFHFYARGKCVEIYEKVRGVRDFSKCFETKYTITMSNAKHSRLNCLISLIPQLSGDIEVKVEAWDQDVSIWHHPNADFCETKILLIENPKAIEEGVDYIKEWMEKMSLKLSSTN